MRLEFYLPTIPYSPIDALNRRAAALGSPRYAEAAGHANYNGHHVSLAWNSYRQYYVTEYFWAGRVVLARGQFAHCLAAAVEEYERGALGASVSVYPREDDAEAVALCEATPRLVKGALFLPDGERTDTSAWFTWRHQAASECARDYAHPHTSVLIFDWELMQAASDRNEYETALKTKYGRTYQ